MAALQKVEAIDTVPAARHHVMVGVTRYLMMKTLSERMVGRMEMTEEFSR
jgi:hypothetical protein